MSSLQRTIKRTISRAIVAKGLNKQQERQRRIMRLNKIQRKKA